VDTLPKLPLNWNKFIIVFFLRWNKFYLFRSARIHRHSDCNACGKILIHSVIVKWSYSFSPKNMHSGVIKWRFFQAWAVGCRWHHSRILSCWSETIVSPAVLLTVSGEFSHVLKLRKIDQTSWWIDRYVTAWLLLVPWLLHAGIKDISKDYVGVVAQW